MQKENCAAVAYMVFCDWYFPYCAVSPSQPRFSVALFSFDQKFLGGNWRCQNRGGVQELPRNSREQDLLIS